MKYEIEERPGYILASVFGEIDYYTAAPLEMRLREMLEDKAANLVFDFSKVRYIDSAGIALLVMLAQSLCLKENKIGIFGAEASVGRILQLSGIADVEGIFIAKDLKNLASEMKMKIDE